MEKIRGTQFISGLTLCAAEIFKLNLEFKVYLASHVNLNSVKSLYGGITRNDKNMVENIMEKKELDLFQF